ncbi:MAG: hypothetical protein H7329_20250 [Opitutaceae bacterium]|nr:hypothetical protein [Cytophagales bacterium]
MITKAVLIRFEAKSATETEARHFLRLMVTNEKSASFLVWFDYRTYGVFAAFSNEDARTFFISGKAMQQVAENSEKYFESAPTILKMEILANKIPIKMSNVDNKGLLLSFHAKEGNEAQVAQFLRNAESMVDEEPGTTAWFAFSSEDGVYGIFDVFPGNGERVKHLLGQVPREMIKKGFKLIGSIPDVEFLKVLEETEY